MKPTSNPTKDVLSRRSFIGPNDKLRVRKPAGSSTGSRPEWQEVSALDSANEWIRHTCREGWNL